MAEEATADTLVDWVIEQLALRRFKSQIKQDLQDLLKEEVSQPFFEALLTRAKERMGINTKRSKKVFLQEAIAFYERVIASPETQIQFKLKAQESLAELVGLHREADRGSAEEHAAQINEFLKRTADADNRDVGADQSV